MGKWIRLLLIVIVLVGVFIWLFVDQIIKVVIETKGTEAVGAKVELDGAHLRWWPVALELTQLQVTNPKQPMKNIIEAEYIDITPNVPMLWKQKIIIEDMVITGLQFFTERTTSGAIGTTIVEDDTSISDTLATLTDIDLPELTLPDPETLLQEAQMNMQARLDNVNNTIDQLQRKWQQRLTQLPGKQQLSDYQTRLQQLKKANIIEQLSGIAQLSKDVQEQLATFQSLDKQIASDIAMVNKQFASMTNLPGEEINRLLSTVDLLQEQWQLLNHLIGGQQWQALLREYTTLYQELLAGTGDEDVAPVDLSAPPDFLIKNGDFTGSVAILDHTIAFAGWLRNVTHQPRQWHEPATFQLDSVLQITPQQDNPTLSITGLLDHRTDVGNDEISFGLDHLLIDDYTLPENTPLIVNVRSAQVNSEGLIVVHGSSIAAEIDARLAAIEWDIQRDDPEQQLNKTYTIIAEALEEVALIELSLSINGELRNPTIVLTSNFDDIVANAVTQQLQKQALQLRQQLTRELSQQWPQQLQQSKSKLNVLDSLQQQIGDKEAGLKGLLKNI